MSDSISFDSEAALEHERLAPGAIDPDHHLWRNGRLWWIAFTVHRGHQQERIRFSLGTNDVVEARRLRDRALALFQAARDCEVSLRFAPRRAVEVSVHRVPRQAGVVDKGRRLCLREG